MRTRRFWSWAAELQLDGAGSFDYDDAMIQSLRISHNLVVQTPRIVHFSTGDLQLFV